ncbi:acyl-CoA N-acyltransferase [Apodospora peruviana]|uniref:Acyl-CoA N-acyltransferase n=1 Tax=Apodospora peruviana TaxID=516989 RepID=A0AAE0M9H2_9PEZI|nr:acyl-CoA N-acyltransferase [Apodospora peruviana]
MRSTLFAPLLEIALNSTMESMARTFATAFRSPRLVYRSIEDTDADRDMIATTLEDPVTHGFRHSGMFAPGSRTSSREIIGRITKSALLAVLICLPPPDSSNPSDGPGTELARAQAKGVPIGTMVLFPGKHAIARMAFISLALQEKYQNKGYGAEAINWLLDWGFRFGGLHRIEIGAAAYNDRAVQVYERKLGFKREGVRREAIWMDRKWHDIVEFAMLEWEWEELRGRRQLEGNSSESGN